MVLVGALLTFVFAHSQFSYFYSCLFQNCGDVRGSYFLICLFLLSSSTLVLNHMYDSLSEFPSISRGLFKIQRPKVKMPLQVQNIRHAEDFFFFFFFCLGSMKSFLFTAQVIPARLLPSPLGNVFMMKCPLSPSPCGPCRSSSH